MGFFASIWHKYLGGKSTPWASIGYADGRMTVKDFNKSFADNLRDKFSNLIDETHTDKDVVKLFIDRENIEHEDPKLEVKHSGIMEDGQIKIELDWNSAFIRHLAENGITGETEEEAVRAYLELLTLGTLSPELREFTDEEIDNAFAEQDRELEAELEEAKERLKRPKKRSYRKG